MILLTIKCAKKFTRGRKFLTNPIVEDDVINEMVQEKLEQKTKIDLKIPKIDLNFDSKNSFKKEHQKEFNFTQDIRSKMKNGGEEIPKTNKSKPKREDSPEEKRNDEIEDLFLKYPFLKRHQFNENIPSNKMCKSNFKFFKFTI